MRRGFRRAHARGDRFHQRTARRAVGQNVQCFRAIQSAAFNHGHRFGQRGDLHAANKIVDRASSSRRTARRSQVKNSLAHGRQNQAALFQTWWNRRRRENSVRRTPREFCCRSRARPETRSRARRPPRKVHAPNSDVTVLHSMHTVPGWAAASAPFSPSQREREALSSATMLIMTSACAAASRGELATRAPSAAKGLDFSALRLNTDSGKPLTRRRRAMPEPMIPSPRNAMCGLLIIGFERAASFDHLEIFQFLFVDRQAEAGRVFVQVNAAVLRRRLAVEAIPEQLVADFDIHRRKKFRHRRIQAGHDDVIIVHLPGVRNHGNRMRLGQRGDFARLGEAADAVGVELDVIHRARLDEFAEAVEREFVFAAGNGDAPESSQFRVAVDVVGNHRFFEPAQIEFFEQRNHAFGVIQIPAHVGVGHDVHAVADRLAHGADEREILLHAFRAVGRPPAETQLHRLVTFVLVLLRFAREFIQRRAVKPAGINGNFRFRASAEQTINRLLRGLAENVPQRDVHRADGDHADAFAAKRHRLAIHVLPEKFDVPRVRADEQRLEIKINDLLGDARRERGVADAGEAVVGENFHDEPAVKRERAHGRLGQHGRNGVHRVGAKMRRQRNGFAAPFDDAGADFLDFHPMIIVLVEIVSG